MSEAEARPTNFIRQIIDEDLASGKHTTVHTVSAGAEWLSAYWPCEIYLPELQDRPGTIKASASLRFDDTNPVKKISVCRFDQKRRRVVRFSLVW